MITGNEKTGPGKQTGPHRYLATWLDQPQLVGRIAVVAALIVFIVTYTVGVVVYGPLIGIGLGWIPAATAAWVVANLVAMLAGPVTRMLARFS